MAVSPNPTYASELFGADSVTIKYPDKMTPKVTVTIPANRTFAAVTTGDDKCAARDENHDGSVEITFTVLGGTFASNVTGLMYDRDGAPRNGTGGDNAIVCGTDASADLGCEDEVAAPASVASIVSGGRANDDSVTIKIAEAGRGADNAAADGTNAARPSAVVPSQPCNT
ncbi:MAG: hypothetical protein OXS50_11885, partial [Gammaproteobacteria bacterium]|nr:hypothetical protein [Gammaproteobacteria bacterium]